MILRKCWKQQNKTGALIQAFTILHGEYNDPTVLTFYYLTTFTLSATL